MGSLHAIILGVVQGLTEFLPVSSSGHLVLFQSLFGIKEPELFFDVSVHMGTLLSVCVFFYKDLKDMATALLATSTWSVRSGSRCQQTCDDLAFETLRFCLT